MKQYVTVNNEELLFCYSAKFLFAILLASIGQILVFLYHFVFDLKACTEQRDRCSRQSEQQPKFHYTNFCQNFPVHRESREHTSWKLQTETVTNPEIMKFLWMLQTQIIKVVDAKHLNMPKWSWQWSWHVYHKPVCVALMEFSPLQCTRKVSDKAREHKSRKSVTQIMKVGDKIWRRLSWFV